MKPNGLERDDQYEARVLADLEYLINLPEVPLKRPCSGCDRVCEICGSKSCTCHCSPTCESAPKQLSSDGDRYPLEPGITPLVYRLHCLGVASPYWSCEGHLDSHDEIFRVPQVWFYSRSLIYPKLVLELLSLLKTERRLNMRWQIKMAHVDDDFEAGFNLLPDTDIKTADSLRLMQADAATLAEELIPGMKRVARSYLQKHRQKASSIC